MDLTLEKPGDHLFIRSVSGAGIQVADVHYSGPIILSATRIVEDWTASEAIDLAECDLEKILDLDPEIVLLGTGASQVFLPARTDDVFLQPERRRGSHEHGSGMPHVQCAGLGIPKSCRGASSRALVHEG